MNTHLTRGHLFYEHRRFTEAAEQFRQALGADPNDPSAKSWLALCLLEERKFEEATRLAEESIHAAPDDEFSHYVLARTLWARNRRREALASVREAIRLQPYDAANFALESQIHLDLRDWQAALDSADRGLEIDPENVGCNNLRSIALTKLGRGADASTTMASVLARHPEDAVSHATQGWNYLHGGKTKVALDHFREAMRLDPNQEWARAGIVEALKARNPIYGLLLRYFLWMSRLSGPAQGFIILGAYFGNQLLRNVAQAQPALAPWILPIQIAYIVFALSTWLASPFFDLVLRLDKYGRHALSREQTIGSNWLGLCLAIAVAGLIGCLFAGFDSPWFWILVVFGIITIPVSGIFRVSEGWPRVAVSIVSVALALLGTGAITLFWLGRDEAAASLAGVFAIGVFITSIGINALMFHRIKK
ncbi:MAG TPA: tetratricopeptide repeat protein [Chthoniobacterales bacterium]